MGEVGTVIDLKDNSKLAVISFMRTEACAKCKACMAGFSESEMILEAKNNLGAQKGNVVEIELPEHGFLTATIIMYGLPVVVMVLGFLGGSWIADTAGFTKDLFAFFIGIWFMMLTFFIIHLNERKIKKIPIFLPFITRIIEG